MAHNEGVGDAWGEILGKNTLEKCLQWLPSGREAKGFKSQSELKPVETRGEKVKGASPVKMELRPRKLRNRRMRKEGGM